MDNEEKYLDPSQNPFIETGETPASLKPGEEGFDGRVPLMNPILSEEEAAKAAAAEAEAKAAREKERIEISPEALSERIAAAFPDRDEIEIGKMILVKMASGLFHVKQSGQSIGELPLADLMALSDYLLSRQKG